MWYDKRGQSLVVEEFYYNQLERYAGDISDEMEDFLSLLNTRYSEYDKSDVASKRLFPAVLETKALFRYVSTPLRSVINIINTFARAQKPWEKINNEKSYFHLLSADSVFVGLMFLCEENLTRFIKLAVPISVGAQLISFLRRGDKGAFCQAYESLDESYKYSISDLCIENQLSASWMAENKDADDRNNEEYDNDWIKNERPPVEEFYPFGKESLFIGIIKNDYFEIRTTIGSHADYFTTREHDLIEKILDRQNSFKSIDFERDYGIWDWNVDVVRATINSYESSIEDEMLELGGPNTDQAPLEVPRSGDGLKYPSDEDFKKCGMTTNEKNFYTPGSALGHATEIKMSEIVKLYKYLSDKGKIDEGQSTLMLLAFRLTGKITPQYPLEPDVEISDDEHKIKWKGTLSDHSLAYFLWYMFGAREEHKQLASKFWNKAESFFMYANGKYVDGFEEQNSRQKFTEREGKDSDDSFAKGLRRIVDDILKIKAD